MKLLEVRYPGPIQQEKMSCKHWWSKQYWIATEAWWVEITVLDERTNRTTMYRADIAKLWISDRRSGSSLLDWIIPKKGSSLYQAGINFHDLCYSGHLDREIADEILKLIMAASPDLTDDMAETAHKFVRRFGESGYYPLAKSLPAPYTFNRLYEKLTITG